RSFVLVSILLMIWTAEAAAQSPTVGELEKRLEEMRSQIVAIQNQLAELQAAARTTVPPATTDAVHQRRTLPASVSRAEPDEVHGREEPNAFQYKGLSVTPGGFLEGTTLFRTRNENADIANSYSTVPLDGSSNAHLSEFRGTARNSEFSLLIQGTAATAKLKSFVDVDF